MAKVARDRGRGLRRVKRRKDGAERREQRVGEHGEALGEEIGCLYVVQVQAGIAVGILHVFDGAALDDGIALISEGIDELCAHLREAARLHRDGVPGLGRQVPFNHADELVEVDGVTELRFEGIERRHALGRLGGSEVLHRNTLVNLVDEHLGFSHFALNRGTVVVRANEGAHAARIGAAVERIDLACNILVEE